MRSIFSKPEPQYKARSNKQKLHGVPAIKAVVVVPGEKAVNIENMAKPEACRAEVLVRTHAASLDFRDLVVAQGMYASSPKAARLIPLSNGAG